MYVIPGIVYEAVFLERPNRFIAIVLFREEKIRCHLANPGRMQELLYPQVKVLIRMSDNPKRLTKASLVGVYSGDELVQLNSNLVQKWLPYAFQQQEIPGMKGWKMVQQEVTIGAHRFDYILLNPANEQVITEVKSTTRVTGKTACFPDGISKRATSHVEELLALADKGKKTLLLFVLQRKANTFWPCESVDPAFTAVFRRALKETNMKVRVVRASANLNEEKLCMQMQFEEIVQIKAHHNL